MTAHAVHIMAEPATAVELAVKDADVSCGSSDVRRHSSSSSTTTSTTTSSSCRCVWAVSSISTNI